MTIIWRKFQKMINKLLRKYKKMSIMARASLWAFVASIIQKGISVLATPIFTRLLSAEEYAQYTLYQSWYDIFIIFASLNVFNYATYSAMNEYKDDKNGFIATAQILVTGLCLICFAIYYIVHIFYGDIISFPLPIIVIMFLDILFFSAFSLWCSKQRYEYKYKLMTILSVIIGTMGPILGLIAIQFSKNKGYGHIYGVAFINILIGLGAYIYNFRNLKGKFNKKYVKFILSYCIPLIPHFLSAKLLTRFDRIMINDMCNAAQAGIYGLAYSLSSLMIIINDAILKSYTPWTYQTIDSNTKNGLSKLKKNTNYLLILVAAANILLILFAPEAIKIFATAEYYEAIYIIPPVSCSVFFTFLFNIFANIEYYYKETKYVGIASIIAAVANVVLNYIFIRKFGYLAAGYTTLASYILYALGHFIFMKIVSKKHADSYSFYDNRIILVIGTIFTLCSLLIIPLYKYFLIRYLLIFSIGILVLLNRKKIAKLSFKLQKH